MRPVYLVLAIAGAVLPWWHNLQWMAGLPEVGPFTGLGFFVEAFATHVSSSLAWDIVIASTAGLALVVAEVRRLDMARWWPIAYLLLAVMIAGAFALPFFLFVRERHLTKTAS